MYFDTENVFLLLPAFLCFINESKQNIDKLSDEDGTCVTSE